MCAYHPLPCSGPASATDNNCAVEYDPQLALLPDGRGTFFWDGAAGTWFWVDPSNDVVVVVMIQRLWGPDMPMVE